MNMEDSAANAKIVVDIACVSTEDGAANAKTVVDLVCVSTEDGELMQRLWWI